MKLEFQFEFEFKLQVESCTGTLFSTRNRTEFFSRNRTRTDPSQFKSFFFKIDSNF